MKGQRPDIHELMARQHGAASTSQVRKSLRWDQEQSLVTDTTWRREGARVIASRSSPATWHQRVMVATLATRGVASHATAARLHGLDGFQKAIELHITLRYDQRRHHHPGATVHVSRMLDRSDQLTIEGIPTVTVPVCLLQIAEQSRDAMIKALEGCMRDGISAT